MNYTDKYDKTLEHAVEIYNELCKLSTYLVEQGELITAHQIAKCAAVTKGFQISLHDLCTSYDNEISYNDSVIEDLSTKLETLNSKLIEYESEINNLTSTVIRLRGELNDEFIEEDKRSNDSFDDDLSKLIYKLYKRGKELNDEENYDW